MTPFALRIIDEMKYLAEETGKRKRPPSRFVFPSPKGDSPANPQKALERIQKATSIAFRGHDLRRTAASLMTGMGIPRLTVTAVYDRHSYDKEKRVALEQWSKRLMLMVSDLRDVNAPVVPYSSLASFCRETRSPDGRVTNVARAIRPAEMS